MSPTTVSDASGSSMLSPHCDSEQGAAPSPVGNIRVAAPPAAPRMHSVLKWFANLSALGGGAAMAGFPIICLSAWSYVPFFVSHVVWSVFAWKLKEKELMWLNLGALGLDTWAILMRTVWA